MPKSRILLNPPSILGMGLVWLIVTQVLPPGWAESPRFTPGKSTAAELSYVEQVPLLVLVGTPEEIGRQEAELAGSHAKELLAYAPALIKRAGGNAAWFLHTTASRKLVENGELTHRQEIAAFEAAAKIQGDEIMASQTLYDTLGLFGCSSIIIPSELSTTSGPLFGRNLDYVTFGMLHKYNLVKVIRPQGKFAFASIGFPGCFGVLSGMNEHGLCLALHEVRTSADGAIQFDPAGVPTMLALRSLLEECRTVREASEKLKQMKRTTSFNLALCDPTGGGVCEVTVKNVELRSNQGVIACTNHFRCEALSKGLGCLRYGKLTSPMAEKYTVAAIAAKLHDVNQGQGTFQSMIFEPATGTVHVCLDTVPSTTGTWRTLALKDFLAKEDGGGKERVVP